MMEDGGKVVRRVKLGKAGIYYPEYPRVAEVQRSSCEEKSAKTIL